MFCAWSLQMSDKLVTYDEQAIALGHRRKDKLIFIYLYFVSMFIILSIQIYYFISNHIASASYGIIGILITLNKICSLVTGTCCVFIICIFLDLIRQRFRHLNEMIIPHISKLPVTRSQDEITVYDVRYLHGMLLDGAEQINTLYGTGIVFTFLSILLELVWTIYDFIKDIQGNKHLVDNVVQLFDLLFQTIYLVSMYHFTAYEVKTESFIIV